MSIHGALGFSLLVLTWSVCAVASPQASRIRVEGDQPVLRALEAEMKGAIRIDSKRHIATGSWASPEDTLTWRIESPREEVFDAVLSYVCEPGAGGVEFEVSAGASKVRGKVYDVGTPKLFGFVPLGFLSIPAGPSEVTLRALSKPPGPGATVSIFGVTLQKGFEPIFNGKDLGGWWHGRKDGKGYTVENGVLLCPADGGGNLFTDKEYADFTLRFEFRLEEGSNNGVAIRAPRQTPEWKDYDAAYDGMEIQILDDEGYEGKIQPWQRHGSIYNVVPAKKGHLAKRGEWNVENVEVFGSWVRIFLNGATIVEADLSEVKNAEVLKKHPGLARAAGHIGFLGHGTRVEFRNIRLKDERRGR
jgi:hypothetical protein